MTEPLALTLRGTEQVVAWACGECRYVARDEAAARECCEPYECSGCQAKLPKKDHRTRCEACCRRDSDEAEARRFDKAQKVPLDQYDGPLFVGDDWYRDHEEMVDALDYMGADAPAYAWAATPLSFTLDADQIVESALVEHYEDAGENIGDGEIDRLQAFLDKWAKAQGIESYEIDYSRAIVLPQTEPEEEAASPPPVEEKCPEPGEGGSGA